MVAHLPWAQGVAGSSPAALTNYGDYKILDVIHVPAQKPNGLTCKIAFLGEAPGTEELEKGQPFVGPAGKVFNSMLRTAELDRAEFWVGNVFDHKIPENNLENWCVSKQEAEEKGWPLTYAIPFLGILRPEYHGNLDRLAVEIAAFRPHVIVPMGSTALWALTGETDIGVHRGCVLLSSKLVPGVKLLPTFHPAYVMRQWKFFSVVVGDFIKAAVEGETRELVLPSKEFIIEPTLGEVMQFFPRCFKSDLLSVDIETGWGQITCIGFAPNANEAICIPFVDLRKPGKSYWPPDIETIVWATVRRLLESNVPKLGQNFAAYDAFWLLNKYGIRVMNLLHDTRLLHHALYPELPKSLAFMAGSYTRQGVWKNMSGGYGKHREKKRDD